MYFRIFAVSLVAFVLLAGVSSAIVTLPGSDSDGDGVDDADDICPGSDGVVNSDGCTVEQICSGPYENHGMYVSCVARTTSEFVEQGLITGEQQGAIVSIAAMSDIGKI